MKKILATLSMVAVATMLNAQGYIDFTGSAAAISTNTGTFLMAGGEQTGTFGRTQTQSQSPFGYYYVLLYATGTINGSAAPTNSVWAPVAPLAGGSLYGTNSILAGGLNGNGGTSGVQINLPSGTPVTVELVGWSASLGTDWTTVSGELAASTQNGGQWTTPGYFGFTSTATLTPGSTPGGAGDPTIFTGMFPNGSLVLYAVPVPEPTTVALAGLGGLALLAFRRRK